MTNDERLAALLDDAMRQQQEGHSPNLDALAQNHPDLIGELRQLVQVGQLARQFGSNDGARTAPFAFPNVLASPNPIVPRLFDGYNLVEEIGRGAMGVVYKAWDTRLERYVALKVLLRGEHASSEDLARFRSEAQAAAALAHPNIVSVFQVGECDGLAYFCMELVDGETLAAIVRRGPLPPREAARVTTHIARAVYHAHQSGILHRDLKPSNVIVNSEGQPKVTDFGLAKRTQGNPASTAPAGMTASGMIVGTPNYMSPEQAAGNVKAVGPSSDVYSLGAMLYELLTGRPPFQAASAVDVLLMVRGEEAVRPRLLNAGIDPDLELVCLKCLEKWPQHRYASAKLLADDLDAYLTGESVSARASSLNYFFGRIFRETHHAPVMENWGGLWILHSFMLLLLCIVTNVLWLANERRHVVYLLMWGIGLVLWGLVFWNWRRRGGPVTFVERQMAHGWAAGVMASIGIFFVEWLLQLPALTLTPVLAVVAGMVFVFMAGTVSGWFYIPAGFCFLGAWPMALWPEAAPTLFGIVSALGFFVPGWKYYWKRRPKS